MLQKAQKHTLRVLRWSERYTKTDMVYVFKNSWWLSIGQVGIAGIAFILSIAFAHFVPKDDYGTYRYLLSIFWVLTAFSFTGLPTAVTQAIARGFEGTYLKSFRLSMVWSIPMALIAFSISAYYFINGNSELGYGMLLIGALGPLMQPALLFGSLLEGKRDFLRYALYGVALNAVPAVCALIAMQFTSMPIVFVAVYVGGNVVTGLILDIFAYRVHKPNAEVNEDLTTTGAHFSAMNILATIANQVDKLVVFHFLGPIQLAVYSFATALPEQIKGLFNNLSTLAFPKFSTKTIEEVKKNLWGRIGIYTTILVVITSLYILVAPFIFRFIFPAYTDSIIFSQVFAISLIGISNVVPLTLLQAQTAKRELYIFNVLSPFFQIVSLFLLTMFFGLMGTIVARIVTRLFNFLLLAVLVTFHNKPFYKV